MVLGLPLASRMQFPVAPKGENFGSSRGDSAKPHLASLSEGGNRRVAPTTSISFPRRLKGQEQCDLLKKLELKCSVFELEHYLEYIQCSLVVFMSDG